MDELTEKLARTTVNMNLVSRLAGIRIRDELVTILEEETSWKAIKRLNEFDALKSIGLEVHPEKKTINMIKKVLDRKECLSYYLSEEFRQWRMLLIILMISKDRAYVKKWCSQMKLKKKDATIIIRSVSGYQVLGNKLARRITRKSYLYRLLHEIPEEINVILSSRGKIYLENIKEYYSKIEPLKLEITGNDLKSLSFKPSKDFKIVLDKIMEMKIDGKVKDRDDQLAEAKKLLTAFRCR
jgi:tRNA nucleotidyltransferase (CCA-adding enzyme)